MDDQVKKVHIKKYSEADQTIVDDVIAIEDPLEIRILHPQINEGAPKPVSITMRTPGHDIDLSLGFLFTEGMLTSIDAVKDAAQLGPNTTWITLHENVELDIKSLERNFYTTSSCGVCGKASIDSIHTTTIYEIKPDNFFIEGNKLFHLQSTVLEHQSVFSDTGGIHAAALFDVQAELMFIREDVGRHNALDKLIGHAFQQNSLPLDKNVLLLSGRASFELLQKAGMAGIPVVAAVGAPSSLAVEVADRLGITLIGFLKESGFNIYTHAHRVK